MASYVENSVFLVARFVVAESFADAHFDCTIGTGRIGLAGAITRRLHR